VRWQNKYLLPGAAALVIYSAMRLWFHALSANLLATLATTPVVGQCPSYAEYSKVGTLRSNPHMVPTLSLEPSRNAVGGPTGSPIYAAGPHLSDLHKFRSGSKPVVCGEISVADSRARM